MTARIIYNKAGSDPGTIVWPPIGPTAEQWSFRNNVVVIVRELIGYADGTITFPDGRMFPGRTPQGSTFRHVLGV
jgi:hypothetical protein